MTAQMSLSEHPGELANQRSPAPRRLSLLMGPGLLIAVGYMDPGNWATGIAAGAQLGYSLLFMVVLSSLAAMLLQTLALRLGVVTGQDLAQTCRLRYSRQATLAHWTMAEIAIIATDIAEVLGAALAFKLLFNLPLSIGIVLTAITTLVILGVKGAANGRVQKIVLALVAIIVLCFAIELSLITLDTSAALQGFIPSLDTLAEPGALFIAVGIIGATVMPHNLYLHSSLARSPCRLNDTVQVRQSVRRGSIDTIRALSIAAAVQVAILLVAAAVFHDNGYTGIGGIEQAHQLLAPLMGGTLCAVLFALALLASGQSATLTGTLAGQVVLEGFLKLRVSLCKQRIVTRLLAIVPALGAILWLGDRAVGDLLVFSQVVLSIQLPFAVYPLIRFTRDKTLMGDFAISRPVAVVAWLIFLLISAANLWLVTSVIL
ncbi:Divalent metal cation transporter MntH [Pseudomonas fluorescens]|uniref:Divalent metal cation transporter MntH n=1 Tax=Pseudomonas fluorescens TaxID=294 RepID=A0A5E7SGM2_PSEFL|nr:Nramp family divalent metal transporter [Pseudomonas fluorescens]VVP85931.1 Divalent metal cation transporter MntH [Pseudomonas fluorescens]